MRILTHARTHPRTTHTHTHSRTRRAQQVCPASLQGNFLAILMLGWFEWGNGVWGTL